MQRNWGSQSLGVIKGIEYKSILIPQPMDLISKFFQAR